MRILIIDGHPDARPQRFLHALTRAYREGAEAAGHEVKTIAVGAMDFPLLRTAEDFQNGKPPPSIEEAQQKIIWADHLLILFPLWLGAMPAVLKAFFEQTLRPGFAFAEAKKGRLPKKLLRGKTSRIVVTMGMPGFFYRFYLRAHSLKEPGEERSRVLRHQACRLQRNRNDRRYEREAAGELARAYGCAR